MTIVVRRWQVAQPCTDDHLRRFSHLNRLLVQILFNRGASEPEDVDAFLASTYRFDDPFTMRGIPEAVERIRRAISQREPIAVFGDFDADGVTSTALLVSALRGLGAERVTPYIPDRVDEGYGLNCDALENKIKPWGAGLVITVDCGIRSPREVQYAQSLGMDVIVTDHHDPGPELPVCQAVINPKQDGCQYKYKGLAGVGIAFKLAQALLIAEHDHPIARRDVTLAESELIDLVALGTVADVAPLLGENRSLVQRGLEMLRKARRPGIAALMAEARLDAARLDATSIGFGLGPRLNAAGRLASAGLSYKLLTAADVDQARPLASELEQLNRRRQQETQNLITQARRQIESGDPERALFVVSGHDFHRGIVGLAAGRLCEELYRPVLVVEAGGDEAHGSARSIPEFDITAALDRCQAEDPTLLIRYGGHAAAAGFTLRTDRLPELARRLEAIAAEELGSQELAPSLAVDAEVALNDLDYATQKLLAQLEPCGYQNPQPVFCARRLETADARTMGTTGQHLRLQVRPAAVNGRGPGMHWNAVAFGQAGWAGRLPGLVDMAFTLEVDTYNGQERLRLNVKDFKPSEG